MENNVSEQDKRYKLEDFEFYKTAREFRKMVYEVLKVLPREEKHNLASQMRRAAVSISNNIAEGHGRWHHQENIQFCRISRGSIEEIIDDFNVCLDEGYCPGFDLIQFKEGRLRSYQENKWLYRIPEEKPAREKRIGQNSEDNYQHPNTSY